MKGSFTPGVILAAGSETSPMIALLAMVLGGVVFISLLLVKVRQSLLVGYFLCGVLLANSGLSGLLGDDPSGEIASLSEIGIVLLMFTLGIEFSIRELFRLRRVVLVGGGGQMALCILAGMGGLALCGFSGTTLLVVAFALALSSTAVSIKSFQDMGQPNTPGARMALGMAIFQDLAVILFMVLLPSLLSETGGGAMPLVWALLKGVAFLGVCWLLSHYGIPHLLHAVAHTRSRELFTVTVVALCAFIAWGANWIGLSLALGAFAAGLVVSESIYSHRVLADILPFKDLFLTIFFVSVGLMIDLRVVAESWVAVSAGVVAILVVKGVVIFLVARFLKLRLRQALIGAAALSSSGEFSLVLLNQASALGGLAAETKQILLACTAITMGLVPSLMRGALPLAGRLEGTGFFKGGNPNQDLKFETEVTTMRDHVIICGFGPVGRALDDELARAGVETVILEMNAGTVRELNKEGKHVLFADATKGETMELAGVGEARGIAFTFPEAALAVEGIKAARAHNPEILTFARAKFSSGVDLLRTAGVHHIFHDEVTSGAAMVEAVMGCYVGSEKTKDA